MAREMEQYYQTNYHMGSAVHVGAQTSPLLTGVAKEQVYETRHLAAGKPGDLVVLREIDAEYLSYWHKLVGGVKVFTLGAIDPHLPLSQVLLDRPELVQTIKDLMPGNAKLEVFLPTALEHQLADAVGIPLHGSAEIGDLYGTKSGIRLLAEEFDIAMSPGFICSTAGEVKEAAHHLLTQGGFSSVAVKNDFSLGGGWSAQIKAEDLPNLDMILQKQVGDGSFTDGKDIAVVEGWIDNAKASLCAHIEIPAGGSPAVCAAWQQIIDTDGITYMGAGPLQISDEALESFNTELFKLVSALQAKGAVGSYGPDFLITQNDTAVMLELNARTPATRFPLDIIKAVKGEIGSGFMAQHVKMPGDKPITFAEIQQALGPLLITKSQGQETKGVVPFNVGLMPYGMFDLVAIASTWDEAQEIMQQAQAVFH